MSLFQPSPLLEIVLTKYENEQIACQFSSFGRPHGPHEMQQMLRSVLRGLERQDRPQQEDLSP